MRHFKRLSNPNKIGAVIQYVVIVFLCAATLGVYAQRADASEGTWKAGRVGLGDATSAPTSMSMLPPHASITYAQGPQGEQCHHGARWGWFSDVQAYTWQGYAIGAQRWSDRLLAYTWRVPQHGKDGRVTFDGITFENQSRKSVLVAGWCE